MLDMIKSEYVENPALLQEKCKSTFIYCSYLLFISYTVSFYFGLKYLLI